MIKYSFSIVGAALLSACTTFSDVPGQRIENIEEQLTQQQQQSLQLRTKLDELLVLQHENSILVRDEFEETQQLIHVKTKASTTPVKQPESTSRTKKAPITSKAQWLEDEGKVIVGGIENITFSTSEKAINYQARIDTGATSSSLDARDISRFERDGKSWVRFGLFVNGEHQVDVERPIVRWVRIFQSTTEKGERRPVVEMMFTFGDTEDTAEFTLTDRSHLEFSALIGRNLITDRMIVDVSDSFIFTKK